jgi:phosphatidylinositol-3-phosphatase
VIRSLALALCLCLGAACGSSVARALPPAKASPPTHHLPSSAAAPSSAPGVAGPSSVFVIVMENRSYDQAMSGGYTAALAASSGLATNYHGVSHPSLPNYLAMTSGSTWGIADDGYHSLPLTGLGAQLTGAGVTWRAYMEGMASSCLASRYPYALKHDPFPYYGGRCPSEVVPFAQFGVDAQKGDLPGFVWITPGLCNDGHDCSTAVADRWLSQVVPEIQATSAWQHNGVLIITWDEGEDSANHILTLVIRPGAPHEVSNRYYDHYSLLATIEDRFGVARLGAARQATPLTDLMISGAVTQP